MKPYVEQIKNSMERWSQPVYNKNQAVERMVEICQITPQYLDFLLKRVKDLEEEVTTQSLKAKTYSKKYEASKRGRYD